MTMRTSEQINELAGALAKAQGALDDAEKAATNPHFRSRYADLAAVRDAIRVPLSSNGLSYVQMARGDTGAVEVETMLMHSSGQFIADTLRLPVLQNTPQAFGSALTYARRYSLMAMVGIAASEDDDDGNKATERAPMGPPVVVSTGRPDAAKEPAVSSKAIGMAREVKDLKSIADIEAFKKTGEFQSFWHEANAVDRKHVVGAVERKKAQFAPAEAAE
jgi:2-methylisocitrate lyase-like PEP mutase family enzyme